MGDLWPPFPVSISECKMRSLLPWVKATSPIMCVNISVFTIMMKEKANLLGHNFTISYTWCLAQRKSDIRSDWVWSESDTSQRSWRVYHLLWWKEASMRARIKRPRLWTCKFLPALWPKTSKYSSQTMPCVPGHHFQGSTTSHMNYWHQNMHLHFLHLRDLGQWKTVLALHFLSWFLSNLVYLAFWLSSRI